MRPSAAALASCVLAALLSGCARQPDLTPRPQRLVAAGAALGERPQVSILGAGFFPRAVQSASGGPASLDTTHRAWFDDDEAGLAVADLAWVSEGELRGTIPAGLALGPHALTVVNALGHAGRLEAAFTVIEPASLEIVEAAASRERANVGQAVALRVTVRHAGPPGSAPVRGVVVRVEPSGAGAVAGPLEAPPFDLAAQQSREVDLALTGAAPGAVRLAAAAAGRELATEREVTAAAPPVDLLVQRPASLRALLAIPDTLPLGPFTATMTVWNDGEADAVEVVPSDLAPVAGLSGVVAAAPGPAPAAARIPGGGRATFTSGWIVGGLGEVVLSGRAVGADGNDGLRLEAAAVRSNRGSDGGGVRLSGVDLLGDGTPVAALASRGGALWLGPSDDGRTFWRKPPGDAPGGRRAVQVAVDPGPTEAENKGWQGVPWADTFGAAGCTTNSTGCGPSNERGRGVLAAGAFGGVEWLLYAGASSIRARYLYLSPEDGPPVPFRAVDLDTVLATSAVAPTAALFAPAAPGGPGGADRLYVAFADKAASKSPHLVALAAAPAQEVLDPAAGADALDLGLESAPGLGGGAGAASSTEPQPRVEALAWFRGRLYVASGHGLLRAAVAVPRPYPAAPADWIVATPSAAAWGGRTPLPASQAASLTPADRAVPALAAFGDCAGGPCLFLIRNVMALAGRPDPPVVPQLWRCDPAAGGDPDACDPGDWALALPNAAGDPALTQLGVASNGAASVLLATERGLYLGFDNRERGAQLYRADVAPARAGDFRGRDGCLPGAPACAGLGGGGLGHGDSASRLFDAEPVVDAGRTTVYLTGGSGLGPVHLFALPE